MILTGGHSAEQERAQFVREPTAGARLQHPNIVPIYEPPLLDSRSLIRTMPPLSARNPSRIPFTGRETWQN